MSAAALSLSPPVRPAARSGTALWLGLAVLCAPAPSAGELFGDAGQQKAFAIFAPVMGLAAVAGPVVGGGLVDAAAGHALLLAIAFLAAAWAAVFWLPRHARAH